MDKELNGLLEEGIKKIDSSLCTPEILRRLSVLYDQISLFNPSLKLVAAQGRELVVRHILDSLAPSLIIKEKLRENSSVADLGSGSGLPGFVLASALENLHFTLVDKMGRRIGFLRNTAAVSGMADKVEICQSEIEKLNGKFDALVFRAFRPLKEIIGYLDKITDIGSFVFIYKSSEENISEEAAVAEQNGKYSIEILPYTVPFSDSRRSLLVLKKLA